MRGGEGLARLAQYQVFRDTNDALILPFLLAGDYTAPNGQRLNIASDYPLAAGLTLTNPGPAPLTLKLYFPAWIEGIPGRDTYGWLPLTLAPGETRALIGTLVEATRDFLPSTQAFMAAHPTELTGQPLQVHTRGALILAQRPACCDREGSVGLHPIYQAYLDGITLKEHSPRRLLVTRVSSPNRAN